MEEAQADSNSIYVVEGTDGGVWSRYSPHQNDTPHINGQGAYDGDRVQLECGVTNGDPVGPYANHTWHKVKDLSRSEPDFWLNDHWIASPNKANELAPGEPSCESASQPLAQEPMPDTPKRISGCKTDKGEVALKSTINALNSIDSNGSPKSQLERYADLWGNPDAEIVCFSADVSEVDNGRRFIGSIAAAAPNFDPPGCAGSVEIEVWGQDFYKKTACTSPTKWDINKWLPVGTYVCAARSDAADTVDGKNEAGLVAAVKSSAAKMGEDDPFRSVVCSPVKE